MKLFRAFLVMIFAVFLSAGAFSRQQQPPPQNQNTQVIDMTAKKYKFTPSPIHIKKGTKVELRITATDHNHGFKINAYPDGAAANGAPGLVFTSPQDCWKVPKGQTVTIEFVAQTPGSYPFKCCVFCGFGHMGMKGELIVDE
ncbi:MAG TPA: cupredoxin domain-containing protein [Candidatus Acidoferrales bacterium]|nr:cupredoxin domain-containing protein [Candidatus Acidoferrales bacterium]